MPNYASLSTQIDSVKSEITSSLAASTYTAQDLVFVSAALKNLGEMLGVNDIVAATADGQNTINTLVTNILNGTANATTGKLYVGGSPAAFETSASLTNPVGIFRYNPGTETASFAQVALNNTDATSSTDYIAYASNGDDTSGFIDMGIAGDKFSVATYGITGPQDGYIFSSSKTPITKTITNKGLSNNVATITTSTAHGYTVGKKVLISGVDSTFNGTYTIASTPSSTTFTYAKTASNVTSASSSGTAKMYFGTGNLVLATDGTGSENAIVVAAGGYASGNTQVKIWPDQTVAVAIATPSTSPTTGAVTVTGGVGISGDMNIAGNVTINGQITFAGGSTQVTAQNLAVTDPAIFVANNNVANITDFTFAGKYVSSGTKYAAFSKRAADGIWRLVSGFSTAPGTTIDLTQAGLVYDTMQVNQVILQSQPTLFTHAVTLRRHQDDFVLALMQAI